jgi:hypothetical protein
LLVQTKTTRKEYVAADHKLLATSPTLDIRDRNATNGAKWLEYFDINISNPKEKHVRLLGEQTIKCPIGRFKCGLPKSTPDKATIAPILQEGRRSILTTTRDGKKFTDNNHKVQQQCVHSTRQHHQQRHPCSMGSVGAVVSTLQKFWTFAVLWTPHASVSGVLAASALVCGCK